MLAIPYGPSAEVTLDNLRQAIEKEGIFALVGAYTIGMDEQILAVLRENGIPLIGPFTLNPGDALINADSFYIYPGFAEQTRALADQALSDEGELRIVFAGPGGVPIDALITAGKRQLSGNPVAKTETLRFDRGEFDADTIAMRLAENEANAVMFLGNQSELEALLRALSQREQNPRIYALSAFVPRPLYEVPETFHERIFLAYPTLSSDITSAGRTEYRRLADLHALPPDHLQGQIASLAAAKLLIEGLRDAGRTLNRERLVEAIEKLYRYDTGLTPPLTYGPNRRIGAMGAHVVAVDLIKKTNTPVGEWHEVR